MFFGGLAGLGYLYYMRRCMQRLYRKQRAGNVIAVNGSGGGNSTRRSGNGKGGIFW